MKVWKKVAIGGGAFLLVALIVGLSVRQSSKNVVTVQTGKVQREDLATVVSASGEIKPKVYVNIGANAFGKITHLYVKEGDQVKKGQMLAQLENVQSSADVQSNQASLDAAGTDAMAAAAAVKTAEADQRRAQADYDRNKMDWERAPSPISTAARMRGPRRTPDWCKRRLGWRKPKRKKIQPMVISRRLGPRSRTTPTCCRRPLTPRPSTASSPTFQFAKARPW